MNTGSTVERIIDTRVYFESIVQTVREPLLMLDEELRVVSANNAFYRLFQVSKEETEHKHIYELGSGQWDMDGLKDVLRTIIPVNEQFQDYEVRYDFPRIGYKVMLLNGRRIDQGEGRPRLILLAMEDITGLVEREQKLQQYVALIEDSNEQLKAFDYTLSHDLRAPLNVIVQFAELLQEKEGARLDDDSRHMLGVLRARSLEMQDYIRALLQFSRIGQEEVRAVAVDMTEMARSVAREVAAAFPGRDLRIEVQPLPEACGNPAMLRQVWVNLLGNAAKFTRGSSPALVGIAGSSGGKENVYSVRDNGIGFDMKQAEGLFGLFKKLHTAQAYEGTGAGLAIVRRIVQRHRGRVWAESKPGEGAAFYFSLPKGGL